MQKHLITKNTIAILKNKKKTIIINVENIQVINKTLNAVLEYNCNFYGSSLQGKIKSAKQILASKYKIPICLNLEQNIILIPFNSMRQKSCLYLVANKILDYKSQINYTLIKCFNNYVFKVSISQYSLEKLLLNTIKLNNVLKSRKLAKLL